MRGCSVGTFSRLTPMVSSKESISKRRLQRIGWRLSSSRLAMINWCPFYSKKSWMIFFLFPFRKDGFRWETRKMTSIFGKCVAKGSVPSSSHTNHNIKKTRYNSFGEITPPVCHSFFENLKSTTSDVNEMDVRYLLE